VARGLARKPITFSFTENGTDPGNFGELCRQLMAKGKHANQVVVAMARELAGCMGAMAQQVPVTASSQDA
jgi:hypothetical protein